MLNTKKIFPSQFLRIEKFNKWDNISILIYLAISILISFFVFNYQIDKSIWLSAYAFGTPVLLYIVNYKSLRNFGVYIIWIGFSIYHLWLYYQIIDNEQLISSYSDAYKLKYTWIFLLFFQMARFIHLKFKRIELVTPGYGGGLDPFDNRQAGVLDYLFFIVFFIIWVLVLPMSN